MQSAGLNEDYISLFNSEHETEFKLTFDGQYDYGMDYILTLKQTAELFGSTSEDSIPSIGNCISGQMDITMRNFRTTDTIPKFASIVPKFRLKNGSTVYPANDWISKKTYYIYTREKEYYQDNDLVELTIHAYDSMIKADEHLYVAEPKAWAANTAYKLYDECIYSNETYICKSAHTSGSSFDSTKWDKTTVAWPKTDITVVQLIASIIGVQVDPATVTLMNKSYSINYPGYGENSYTMRETLGYIAALYAGNFFIDDSNKLKLLEINPSTTPYIHSINDSSVPKIGEKTKPIAKLIVNVEKTDNDTTRYEYPFGTVDGKVLEIDCPYVKSQQMAQDIYTKIAGLVYQPITIDEAVLNPALELGDGMSIQYGTETPVQSAIFSFDLDWDSLFTGSVSAPDSSEVEKEFKIVNPTQQKMIRQIDKLDTEFLIQAGQIASLISGQIKTYRSEDDPSKASGAVMHIGDLWYCLKDQTAPATEKANTWYRWDYDPDAETPTLKWFPVNASVKVADEWNSENEYHKNDIVTKDGNGTQLKLILKLVLLGMLQNGKRKLHFLKSQNRRSFRQWITLQ